LPVARFREIAVLDGDIWLHSLQDSQICTVLVENHNVGVALGSEARDQILADQAGAARKNDFIG